MYELTTLHRAARVLFNRPDDYGHGCPPLNTNKNPEYSSHLRDLIRDCLNFDPGERPDLEQLNRITTRHARMTRDALAYLRTVPEVAHEQERLYYRDNEINTMMTGNYIPSRLHDQIRRESGFMNPDISVLRYPQFRPYENSDEAAGGARDNEDEGSEGKEWQEPGWQKFQFHQTTEEEDNEMDVDEPTIRPRPRGTESWQLGSALIGGGPLVGRGMNRFGRPRMF